MKRLSIALLLISLFSLSSCEVLLAVLEASAEAQQQEQQRQQDQQGQDKNTKPPADGTVLNSEKNEDNSKSTIDNSNSKMYSDLDMNQDQITKYESILKKYKAKGRALAKEKKGDRAGLKKGLDIIKKNQTIEIKNVFSTAQYSKYQKMMANGVDKGRS